MYYKSQLEGERAEQRRVKEAQDDANQRLLRNTHKDFVYIVLHMHQHIVT